MNFTSRPLSKEKIMDRTSRSGDTLRRIGGIRRKRSMTASAIFPHSPSSPHTTIGGVIADNSHADAISQQKPQKTPNSVINSPQLRRNNVLNHSGSSTMSLPPTASDSSLLSVAIYGGLSAMFSRSASPCQISVSPEPCIAEESSDDGSSTLLAADEDLEHEENFWIGDDDDGDGGVMWWWDVTCVMVGCGGVIRVW